MYFPYLQSQDHPKPSWEIFGRQTHCSGNLYGHMATSEFPRYQRKFSRTNLSDSAGHVVAVAAGLCCPGGNAGRVRCVSMKLETRRDRPESEGSRSGSWLRCGDGGAPRPPSISSKQITDVQRWETAVEPARTGPDGECRTVVPIWIPFLVLRASGEHVTSFPFLVSPSKMAVP